MTKAEKLDSFNCSVTSRINNVSKQALRLLSVLNNKEPDQRISIRTLKSFNDLEVVMDYIKREINDVQEM